MDSAKPLLFSIALLFTILVAAAQLADKSTFHISADALEQWETGISFYNEELGEGMEEEAVDGAPNRRSLFWKRAIHYYISYGALSANRVPCPPRSEQYRGNVDLSGHIESLGAITSTAGLYLKENAVFVQRLK